METGLKKLRYALEVVLDDSVRPAGLIWIGGSGSETVFNIIEKE